jgi:glutaconyl-CoA/methylmalonyl-CoA decarboxylase subunit gamma
VKEFDFVIHGNNYNVKILSFSENTEGDELAKLSVNSNEYEVLIKHKTAKTPLIKRVPVIHNVVDGGVLTSQDAGQSLSKIKAPLPGVVIKLNCKLGDRVKIGDTVLVLEAMKIHNEIQAANDGVVKTINVREGQSVVEGEELIIIE